MEKKKKTYKDFQTYLRSEFDKWALVLGITDVRWMIPDEPHRGAQSMSVMYRFPYKRAWIWWSKRDYIAWKGLGYDEDFIPHAILHECLHVVLWELSNFHGKKKPTKQERFRIEESVTDHLANIIWSLSKTAKPSQPNK